MRLNSVSATARHLIGYGLYVVALHRPYSGRISLSSLSTTTSPHRVRAYVPLPGVTPVEPAIRGWVRPSGFAGIARRRVSLLLRGVLPVHWNSQAPSLNKVVNASTGDSPLSINSRARCERRHALGYSAHGEIGNRGKRHGGDATTAVEMAWDAGAARRTGGL